MSLYAESVQSGLDDLSKRNFVLISHPETSLSCKMTNSIKNITLLKNLVAFFLQTIAVRHGYSGVL